MPEYWEMLVPDFGGKRQGNEDWYAPVAGGGATRKPESAPVENKYSAPNLPGAANWGAGTPAATAVTKPAPTGTPPTVSRRSFLSTLGTKPAPAAHPIPIPAAQTTPEPLSLSRAASALGHSALSPIQAQLDALGARTTAQAPAPMPQASRIPTQGYAPQYVPMYSPTAGISEVGPVGAIGTAAQRLDAVGPRDFFALNAQQGGAQFPAMYQQSAPMGQSAQQLLAQQPNLTPGMLGGMQNAGVMTDRLGNRIFAPVAGFAMGGEVQEPVEQQEDSQEGEARQMLANLSAKHRAEVAAKSRGGAETPKNLTMTVAAIPEMMAQEKAQPKTAKAELLALANQIELQKKAHMDAAKGLNRGTLMAATLEKPSLAKEKLSVKRFAEGGEAKKAKEAGDADGPSASDLLRRLGLSVARGVPQAVTGIVDLAALPLTATGRMKAEDVVGTTDYLTKRRLLPPPQKGVASESAELLSGMVSPGGAAKAAVLGPLGLIKAAQRSKAFKAPGMTVPEGRISASDMLKMLEEQGIDTSRTWLRGKKEDLTKIPPPKSYEDLLYVYENIQKRPDAVEAALRDSGRDSGYLQGIQGRTLSRQPGDRSVTKFNTKGGVWLTDSPTVAQTYSGERGYVIPVYARKPDVTFDAKGEQWADFYRRDKAWNEALVDPKVRLIEVQNIIDAGPHTANAIPLDSSEEALRSFLTATNLFAKKPFESQLVNKLTGEPYQFKHGGAVQHAA